MLFTHDIKIRLKDQGALLLTRTVLKMVRVYLVLNDSDFVWFIYIAGFGYRFQF